MKRKFWNWIKNDAGDEEERTLVLNGEISDETWYGDEVTPALFAKELNAGSGNITVWINSPGGDVYAAAQIYNMLMEYKGNVTVKVDALAASAATVIAMAGTTVLMSPPSLMMIHNPITVAIGDSKEMQKAGEMLNEVKEGIMNAYEIKTGMDRKKISHLMDAESWFNAKRRGAWLVRTASYTGRKIRKKMQRADVLTHSGDAIPVRTSWIPKKPEAKVTHRELKRLHCLSH